MHTISNNGIITMTRGDFLQVPLFINAGDETDPARYKITDNDTVYLGIMEPNTPFEHSLIRKVYTKENTNKYGDVVIELGLDDTQYLQPGTYYYEAKLKRVKQINGTKSIEIVDTIVPRRKLFIVE